MCFQYVSRDKLEAWLAANQKSDQHTYEVGLANLWIEGYTNNLRGKPAEMDENGSDYNDLMNRLMAGPVGRDGKHHIDPASADSVLDEAEGELMTALLVGPVGLSGPFAETIRRALSEAAAEHADHVHRNTGHAHKRASPLREAEPAYA